MSILVSDIITYARQIAQTDSNGLTDTLGLAFTNDAMEDYTRRLLERNIDASQIQEAYTDLVAGTGTYLYPTDMYSLKTIELNYTDSNQNNYLQADQFDISNIQGTSFDYVRKNQSTQSPLFDDHGDWYEVFPTPLTGNTAGIKMFYFLKPTEFSSTSSTVGYPFSIDYRCLSFKVAALWSSSVDQYDDVELYEKEYERRMKGIIEILAPGTQQPIKTQALQITGWQF